MRNSLGCKELPGTKSSKWHGHGQLLRLELHDLNNRLGTASPILLQEGPGDRDAKVFRMVPQVGQPPDCVERVGNPWRREFAPEIPESGKVAPSAQNWEPTRILQGGALSWFITSSNCSLRQLQYIYTYLT
jgi:hypothetical protein